ncbi:MAG: class I SAM-dependent rRNA methyltransferase [Trueperaceae bacterium]
MSIIISNKGMRRVETGHPWVFDNDLRATEATPSVPGIISVFDQGNNFVGQGLFNPKSKIALRLLTRDETLISSDFFANRTKAATLYRERGVQSYEAFRVIHSESDGLPGLTVDKYGQYLVVQQHSAALEPFMPAILDVLQRHYNPKGILARNDSEVRLLEGLPKEVKALSGEVPEEIPFNEGNVTLFAAPYTGQKTGAFLDQRENHVFAGSVAFGKCLDVFSYHGGFALQLAKQAESVTAVDSSKPALSHIAKAATINGLGNVSPLRGDAFSILRTLSNQTSVKSQEHFDTIVLDPPAFAKGRGGVENAIAGYKEINLQALKLLHIGGRLITASCSYHVLEPLFYAMLQEAAADAKRQVRVLARRGQASCHPEWLAMPETRYLKLAVLEVVDV